MLALYEGAEGLSDGARKRSLEYYDDFFEVVEDDRKYRREILEPCRTIPG